MHLNKKPLIAKNAKRKTEYAAKYIYIHLLYILCTIFKHLKLPVRSKIFFKYLKLKSSIWSTTKQKSSIIGLIKIKTQNNQLELFCYMYKLKLL